ncbi:hypothetical protein EPI10_006475 [Gossypium australe]|uniref:Uncharacterized protein n=1 Tax=Gossypium australe TaxID=47621 RepID=A0A5B6WR69_9ROSI|nr:hypothetical protein EPI10_006475 [Gossypium australe]
MAGGNIWSKTGRDIVNILEKVSSNEHTWEEATDKSEREALKANELNEGETEEETIHNLEQEHDELVLQLNWWRKSNEQ